MKRIVVLGGAGDMARVACKRLAELRQDIHMVLADRYVERARQRAAALGPAFSAQAIDVLDPRGLRLLIRGASLVINATGPYSVLGRPALQAAIDCRADYIDFSDECEAAELMLGLHHEAQEAGITALIGAGIAPGLVNVLVRALTGRLDEADAAQVAWVTGASPRRPGQTGDGRAVIEHMLHSCTGETFTVRDGQRQRIAIARALMGDPRLLIFDEATSALDDESQALIQDNMASIAQGRTVIIIAHRLSAVRHCQRIIALEQGRISESGSHQQLLANGGCYARLWALQQALSKEAS